MLRVNARGSCARSRGLFSPPQCLQRERRLWFKFAKISPSSGLAEMLQGSAPPGGKTMGDTGAALPSSETPLAPHCLRCKVQRPSLEFGRAPNAAPPCLSDLIFSFDLQLRRPSARPSPSRSGTSKSTLGLAHGPAVCPRPHLPCPLHFPKANPPSRLSSKAISSGKLPGSFTPSQSFPDLLQHLRHFCISILKAVF